MASVKPFLGKFALFLLASPVMLCLAVRRGLRHLRFFASRPERISSANAARRWRCSASGNVPADSRTAGISSPSARSAVSAESRPVLRMRSNPKIARPMVNVRLSERDIRVVSKCAISKVAHDRTAGTLYFPQVTPDAVRKSLRRLVEAGYFGGPREHQMTEALHGLDRRVGRHLRPKASPPM